MDIESIIKTAKLGRERKGAQIDACTVFAAALYDVLSGRGVPCKMVCAMENGLYRWGHSVVEVAGRYYDSMGEFSSDIYRVRAKIHPKVDIDIEYRPDYRDDCFEEEFNDLHAFFVKVLGKALPA